MARVKLMCSHVDIEETRLLSPFPKVEAQSSIDDSTPSVEGLKAT